MHPIRQRIESLLARNPVGASFCIALVGLVAFIVLSLTLLGRSALSDADANFDHGAELMRQAAEEIDKTFSVLERIDTPYCSESTLTSLNGFLFSLSFVRDIGFYDDEGRIFCTVSRGLLPRPLPPYSDPQLIHGDLFWSSVSPPIADNRANTVVIKRGRKYEVALRPDAVSSIHEYFAMIWSINSAIPYYVSPSVSHSLVDLAMVRKQMGKSGWIFDTGELTFLSIRPVNNRIIAAAAVPLLKSFANQSAIFPLFLLITIAFVIVLKSSLARKFKKWATLEHRLPSLLVPDNIACHYQPVVALASEKIVGCEVLMRLNDNGKIVAPDALIPTVEANGLHKVFDRAILTKAAQELPLLMEAVSSFELAFNVFPASIDHEELAAPFSTLSAQLKHHQIKICFEITEYHFSESAIPELQRLRAAGFIISVDDFGTGYSNLNTVKRVSPDMLKIDRSFVYDMEDRSIRSSLIPEIVRISKAVGALTVAEGIENVEQAEQLRTQGVDYGQGYYYGKPMRLREFISLYHAQSKSDE